MSATTSATTSMGSDSTATPAPQPGRWSGVINGRRLLYIALVLTAIAYSGTLRYNFTSDDWPEIVNNPNIREWSAVPGYFAHNIWLHVAPDSRSTYYRPIFMLWLVSSYKLCGNNPALWHLNTMFLHLMATVLVYVLARQTLRDDIGAGIAAVLFGLDPIHVEGIAWICGGSEPLVAIFFLGGAVLYFAAERMSGWRYWAAVFSYALALFAKETGAALLPLLFAQDLFISDARWSEQLRRRWMRFVPFLLVTAVYFAARQTIFHGVVGAEDLLSWRQTLLLQPLLLMKYVYKSFAPFGLALFYDVPLVESPLSWRFWLPLLGVLTLGALTLWAVVRRRALVAGACALWFLLPLLPPLVGTRYFEESEYWHDRYLYVPSVGVAILCAWAVRKLSAKRESFGLPWPQPAATLLLAVILGLGTGIQSIYWANNLLLYVHGTSYAPHNMNARNLLANELFKRGHNDLALQTYQDALKVDPDYWKTNFNIALTYMELGALDLAEKYMQRAKQIKAANANHDYFLGLIEFRAGRLADAERSLRAALASSPEIPDIHFGLAVTLSAEGKKAEAAREYKEVIRLQPQNQAAAEELKKDEPQSYFGQGIRR